MSPTQPQPPPQPRASSGQTAPVAMLHGLMLRTIVTPGRLVVVIGLGAIMLLAGFAVGQSDGRSVDDAATLVQNLGLAVVVPVVSLVFATAALGDLRDDRSMVYLWLRPMRPWVVPVSATAAVITLVVPVSAVFLGLGALLTGNDGGVVAGAALSGAFGAAAYASVFVAFSLILKRVLMWGLAYILIWEGFVAGGAAGAARFALRSYTSSIVADLADVSLRLGFHSSVLAIVVLVMVSAVSVVAAVATYARLDVD